MAYRSSSSVSPAGSNIDVPAASGITDGDVLVLFTISDSTSDVSTFPAGFTQLAVSPLTMTFDASRIHAAIKVASSESGAYNITSTGTVIGGLVVFSGRSSGTPTFSTGASTGGTGSASPWNIAATGGTAATGDDLLFIGCSDNSASGDVTHAPPGGFTLALDINYGNFMNGMAAYKDAVSAGATGTIAGTGTLSGSAATAAFLIALPATGGGSSPVLAAGQYSNQLLNSPLLRM